MRIAGRRSRDVPWNSIVVLGRDFGSLPEKADSSDGAALARMN